MTKQVGMSLGALPRLETLKLTILVSAELMAQLDAYAQAHSQLHGTVDATTLIPHMLAAFIARDRGFKRHLSDAAKARSE